MQTASGCWSRDSRRQRRIEWTLGQPIALTDQGTGDELSGFAKMWSLNKRFNEGGGGNVDHIHLMDKSIRKRSSAALIVRRAASKRSAIYEFQAQHLCSLIRFMVQAALAHCEVESVADLAEEDWEAFTELPEYELFTLGAYACGFVCSDLRPDVDLNAVARRPSEELCGMSLPQIRHYVHTLLRAERGTDGYGSFIYEALRAGVLEALCERLQSGSDLYESL